MAARVLPALPFRDFFTTSEMEDFIAGLAAARPKLCSVSSIGTSREGRELRLLTITDPATGEAGDKPAYLIHGNIHATEVAGTHTSLYTARTLLADHPKSDLLRRVAFYLVPRINPDGAERVVIQNARVRSRTDTSDGAPNTIYPQDINGDGVVLEMRLQHPDGNMMCDPRDRRLLIPRRAGARGPFYRVYPEGMVHDWDGSEELKSDGRSFDWNRNWSYDWRPEGEQAGAGDFPFSEPEMRALAEFIHSHRNIFGVLGYHTGPNAVLRPPSTGSLSDMDPEDDAATQDFALVGSKETGFPVVPVIEYHTARSRDINLRGHFHNFGYQHLGLFVYEFELGIYMNSAGIATTEIFATRSEEEYEALERRMMRYWDDHKRSPRMYVPWKPIDHPQLGRVEIGGFISRFRYNPTMADLRKIARGTYRFTLHHASCHPWIRMEDVQVEEVDRNTTRIRARVANRGSLPTHVSNRGRVLARHRGVSVRLTCMGKTRLLSRRGHDDLGDLQASTGSRDLEWFVSAPKSQVDLCRIEVSGGAGGNVAAVARRE